MINLFLSIGVVIGFLYAIYDQFLMDRLKGETQLAVVLQRQAGVDAWISIGLIVLTIAQGVQSGIEPLTLFLLAMMILLSLYLSFFRSPRLLLKPRGFFFGNIYFDYQKIAQINLADQQILVVDLHSGKRLLVRIKQRAELEKVVNFFGGYKQ